VAPASLEQLRLDLDAHDGVDPHIQFDWEAVPLGSSVSARCTVRYREPHAELHMVSATLEQGAYVRTLQGQALVKLPVVPVAAAGTAGRLTAREEESEATTTVTWVWRSMATASSEGVHASRSNGLWNAVKRLLGTTPAVHESTPDRATAMRVEPDSPTRPSGTPFGGDWVYDGPSKTWSVRIDGARGTALVTNAPKVYAPGDTILFIDQDDGASFVGRNIYTDGKFREVRCVLTAPDRLECRLLVQDGSEAQYVLRRQAR
jgi:hypothetical protein